MFVDKGNERSLEGKVTVYAELYRNHTPEPEYFVALASTKEKDINPILESVHIEESSFCNDYESEHNQSLDYYEEDFHIIEFETPSLESISLNKGDVKFIGAYFKRKSAIIRAESYIAEYMKRYINQIGGLLPNPEMHYGLYPGMFLRSAILDNYIKPLIIARKRSNERLKDAILRRFNFFLDNSLPLEVDSVVRIIYEGQENSTFRSKLINYHINKIVAVCQEDYEKAILLRDKIGELEHDTSR